VAVVPGRVVGNLELGVRTVVIVAALVGLRAACWALGLEGMSPTAVSVAVITGSLFIMGLVVLGALSDYRDARRAPTELAAALYCILREAESMHSVWGAPDVSALRRRLIAVVRSLRADIKDGDTRTCQAAIDDLTGTFEELDRSGVPASYVIRLRAEQAGVRTAVLRIYQMEYEPPMSSAYPRTVAFASLIVLPMVTNFGGLPESLVAVAFLAFVFLALLRLLKVMSSPLKSNRDDMSLFLLREFVVQAQAPGVGEAILKEIEARPEHVPEPAPARLTPRR
jgi:hypothetical protein